MIHETDQVDLHHLIRAALTRAGHEPADDVVEELSQHAKAMYERARADGASQDEARRRVDIQIAIWADDATLLTRRASGVPAIVPPPTGTSWAAGLFHDIRYAGRLLRRQWSFSLLVILTMALGIGATTTLFSVTYGVLMKPLPWADADRIVRVEETRGGNRPRFSSFSNAVYLAWREDPATIEALGGWAPRLLTLTGAGDPERIRVTTATASLFDVLGARPLLGTVFTESQEAEPVIVLSEGLWRQRFGADPGIVGRGLQLEGELRTVLGVLPDEAGFPDRDVRAWIPMHVRPTTGNFMSMFDAVARLRPGMTPAQAADEGTARALANPPGADMGMTIRAIFGDDGAVRVAATPLGEAMAGDVTRPLVMLLIAVGLLFVTATANVANLQLARSTTRRREMGIRAALGAGRGRITRQLLIENVVLGLCGGVAGLAVAAALQRALPTWLPADFPRLHELGLDLMVVSFAAVATLVASVVVSVAPALAAGRLNLLASLSEDGAAPAGAGWRSRPARVRLTIMAGQVAIACVLLIGASLLGRSYLALVHADRGFDPASTLTARLQLPGFAYAPERRADIVDSMLERLEHMPDVIAASYTDGPPLGVFGGTAFMIESRQVQASSRTVLPGYFAAMGMRVTGGRDFTHEDIASGRRAFIVNQAFAREYLSDQPVGQFVRGWVRQGPGDWEIIGVVDDVRHLGMSEPAGPEIYQYRRAEQRLVGTTPTFIIRTAGDPLALVPTLRALAREQDPTLVFDAVMTMDQRVMATLGRPRLYAALITAFAGLALLIAAVGLFGTLSYSVAQRSRELAVRGALGAQPSRLVALVLRQGLAVVIVGFAAGLALSLTLVQSIAAMLYGVTTRDPVTYAVVPLILLGVALVACVVPALRAARTDPLRALKGE